MGWLSRGDKHARRAPADEPSGREAALSTLSRKLVGAAGVGEIAQALFREIDDMFQVDQCVLFSVSEDQSHAQAVASLSGMDADVAAITVDLHEDQSAIAQVVRDRAPHRVLDGQRESLQHQQLAQVLGARSALYVPLHTSGGVVAVAVIAMADRPRAFRRDEVEFIQKLANDAAVAIERVRLVHALREAGERELIVASVARAIRDTLETDDVLRVASAELGDHADADKVTIAVLGSDLADGRLCEWSIDHTQISSLDESKLPPSARLALDDAQTVDSRAHRDAPATTEISMPLTHRDRQLGVLTLDRSHIAFEPAEKRLVELIAVEIAAALAYVDLHVSGRKHLNEQLSLARAAQSLTADLRFDRVLDLIVQEVVKLLRTSSAAFYTYDRDGQTLTLRAAYGEAERQAIGERMGLAGLAGRVVRAGVSQFTNDYEAELGEEIHPVFRGVQRAISVPVRWQGDLRGVVSVAGRADARRFTQHDVSLLEAFADLASLALHNADAYSAHARQARIQAGFYRISQVLSSSLSRGQTLTALAQAATEALDGDWSIVIGGDGVDEELHVEQAWQAPEPVVEGLAGAEDFLESTVSIALEHGRVVTAREIAVDGRLSQSWRDRFAAAGCVSQLAVPVNVHQRHSAVVLVCFEQMVRFGDEELVVAANLASAASAALERAGLFENERRMRRLSEVLADVSALLAETLKTQTVLERIVEQAAVLLDVDGCFLSVASGDGSSDGGVDLASLDVRASAGLTTVEIDQLPGSPIGALVEEVARAGRTVEAADVQGVVSADSGAQHIGHESYIGVPLRHPRGYLIGVLSACTRRHRVWLAAETSALESFANSAAIAIRNAELYANIKRERDTIEGLLSSIAEGILATDAAGRVTLWNQAAERLTGVARDHVVGRNWRDVLGLEPDTVVAAGERVIEARPSGTPMWLSVTAAHLHERGQPTGSIYAFRDVSADYTLDRMKSDFVATVSYVLRAPLTSIHGFAHTLLRDDIDFSEEDRRVFTGYIASETSRLTRIVDDLLEVAKIDAGHVEVHVADCSVSDVISDVVERARTQVESRHIEVAADPGIIVRADPQQLRLVIGNLLDNAIRNSPEDAEVHLHAERENGSVQLRIVDQGYGIPPAEQKHLFTRFYVAPGSGDAVGAGLGLYISKGLVTAMGGKIWVSSQPGSGSTFTVELPAGSAERGS